MSELKPCPFCGDEAFASIVKDERVGDYTWTVLCITCDAQSSQYALTSARAIELWNTRTDESAKLRERLAAARDELHNIKFNATWKNETYATGWHAALDALGTTFAIIDGGGAMSICKYCHETIGTGFSPDYCDEDHQRQHLEIAMEDKVNSEREKMIQAANEYAERPTRTLSTVEWISDFALEQTADLRQKLAAARELFTTLLEPVGPFSRNPAVHATAQKGIAIIDGKEAK